MFSRLEALGERMLGMFVPKVTAAAGCPPDPWCATCGTCYFKRCHYTASCGYTCGSCGYNCFAGAASVVSLC
ncbi:hypothetical protein ACFFWC_13970 [Plantactinospora siamensis]|uniref:Uncharacterized protein n=1 Tax=Plantactinospora siamensis TaxID=555372 RepID=A0ABV6P1I1_9ACTN